MYTLRSNYNENTTYYYYYYVLLYYKYMKKTKISEYRVKTMCKKKTLKTQNTQTREENTLIYYT